MSLASPAHALSPEAEAETVWRLRAAFNVAALQCQFDPSLEMIARYNAFLNTHRPSLERAHTRMKAKFRRQYGKSAMDQFDRYNTRAYNSFSAFEAQVPFCHAAADLVSRALLSPGTELPTIASDGLTQIASILATEAPPPLTVPVVTPIATQ